jgi:hypothetical protein
MQQVWSAIAYRNFKYAQSSNQYRNMVMSSIRIVSMDICIISVHRSIAIQLNEICMTINWLYDTFLFMTCSTHDHIIIQPTCTHPISLSLFLSSSLPHRPVTLATADHPATRLCVHSYTFLVEYSSPVFRVLFSHIDSIQHSSIVSLLVNLWSSNRDIYSLFPVSFVILFNGVSDLVPLDYGRLTIVILPYLIDS